MAINLNTIQGDLKPIRNRVIVSNMYFGEQKTKSGLILRDDNGSTRGIYPRWGQVYAKGPENTDEYQIGDWILVEHGRWTRGVNVENDKGNFELRMVETESILAWSNEKPDDVQIGGEYGDGDHATVNPDAFMSPQY
jgi:co-chaperonin GroES (HSP10)